MRPTKLSVLAAMLLGLSFCTPDTGSTRSSEHEKAETSAQLPVPPGPGPQPAPPAAAPFLALIDGMERAVATGLETGTVDATRSLAIAAAGKVSASRAAGGLALQGMAVNNGTIAAAFIEGAAGALQTAGLGDKALGALRIIATESSRTALSTVFRAAGDDGAAWVRDSIAPAAWKAVTAGLSPEKQTESVTGIAQDLLALLGTKEEDAGAALDAWLATAPLSAEGRAAAKSGAADGAYASKKSSSSCNDASGYEKAAEYLALMDQIKGLLSGDWEKGMSLVCDAVGKAGECAGKRFIKNFGDCGIIGATCEAVVKNLKTQLLEDWSQTCVGKATKLEGAKCSPVGRIECKEGNGFLGPLYDSFVGDFLEGKGLPTTDPKCAIISAAVKGWLDTKTVNGTIYPGGICLECGGHGGSLNPDDLIWHVFNPDLCAGREPSPPAPTECPELPTLAQGNTICYVMPNIFQTPANYTWHSASYLTVTPDEARSYGIQPESLPDCRTTAATFPNLCFIPPNEPPRPFAPYGMVSFPAEGAVCLYHHSDEYCSMADKRCEMTPSQAEMAANYVTWKAWLDGGQQGPEPGRLGPMKCILPPPPMMSP